MKLRDCIFDDWKFLLDLRNDKNVRNNSFNEIMIKKDSHQAWLKNSLKSSKRCIRILYDKNGSAGMIREDVKDDNLNLKIVSYAILSSQRGCGLGTLILSLATKNRSETFLAEIKNSNTASIHVAKNNGFKKIKDIKGEAGLYKKKGSSEILDEIERARAKNNVNWMNILRLAMHHAPMETKKLLNKVNSHDAEISLLLKELD